MAKKICQVCGQKIDIYTSVHKKAPFVDGRNYETVCFTCFFVPKVLDQKYNKDGSVKEQTEVPYSCSSLSSARELYEQGSADSLRQAKACVEAVEKSCKGVSPPKKPIRRPEPSWNVC